MIDCKKRYLWFFSRFEHSWNKWEIFGITFQRRRCEKCGYYEIDPQ